eukprot:1043393-Ditylum_brightwellii.AAC.1
MSATGSSECMIWVIFATKAVCMAVNSASTVVLPSAKCRACSSTIHIIATLNSADIAFHAS